MPYDVFICHASEDKDEVARPLADALARMGRTVWLDELQLRIGDSLRQKIDEGVRNSRFGVVILSPAFFRKRWTQWELDGLVQRELATGSVVVLPVWHGLEHDEVAAHSPSLAGKLAASTATGLTSVIEQIDSVFHHSITTGGQLEPVGAAPEASSSTPLSAPRLLKGQEVRLALARGIDAIADVVRTTLGPRGRLVAVTTSGGSYLTRDPVTIAQAFRVEDPVEQHGVNLIQRGLTGDLGDSPASSVVIARELVRECLRAAGDGHDARGLIEGCWAAANKVVSALVQSSLTGTDPDTLRRVVASLTEERDVRRVVVEAIQTVGPQGYVLVEEGHHRFKFELEFVDGVRFEVGALSRHMMVDENRRAVLESPYILLSTDAISSISTLSSLTSQALDAGAPLLIMAEDVSGDCLEELVRIHSDGLTAVAVRAPGFGRNREALLEDLALLTGGEVASPKWGIRIETMMLFQLGRAQRVIVDEDSTLVVIGARDEQVVAKRVAEIKAEIHATDAGYDQEKLVERLLNLSGQVAVIKVPSWSEIAAERLKAEVASVLDALQGARTHGFVAGGGAALVAAAESIKSVDYPTSAERAGADAFRRALAAPLRSIAENAGVDGEAMAEAIRDKGSGYAFDAVRGRVVDVADESAPLEPEEPLLRVLTQPILVAGEVLRTEQAV